MTYSIRPLEWTRQIQEKQVSYTSEGVGHVFTLRSEHGRVRLHCTPYADERVRLEDFDSYEEAITFAQNLHNKELKRYLKHEPKD